GGYKVMLVMGLIGAFLTCAYMTRVIWYTFFGEPRGLSAEHEIHENGPRITVALIILSALAVLAGLANIPHSGILSGVPTSISLQFEKYVEPTGAYFPGALDPAFGHPEFNITIALVSTAIALIAVLLAYAWYWRGLGPHGITER